MENRMRSVKILEELLGYFLHHGIEKLDISFFSDEKMLEVTVKGNTLTPPEDLSHLVKLLNEPRKPEYDEYYWSLLGATGKRQEFQLLGALVDEGDASFTDGLLSIHIKREY